MENDSLGLHPSLPIRANLNLRDAPKRKMSLARNPKSPKGLTRDVKPTRSPTSSQPPDKSRPVNRTSPSRPLVPASERRHGENVGSRSRSGTVGEMSSYKVGADQVGREGRHFTVANVGNNGRIFLRPTVVRPGNERYPEPQMGFPLTPPDTAGLELMSPSKIQNITVNELDDGQFTPGPFADSPSPGRIPKAAYFSDTIVPARRHRRAMSDSTIQDPTADNGAFKVVISKPQNESRSKTAEDIDSNAISFLQVSIPSWKLGTPRFTMRGTPLIRGSSYAPTEDIRSNHTSFLKLSPNERSPHSLRPETLNSRIASTLRPPSSRQPSTIQFQPTGSGDLLSSTLKPNFMPVNMVIEPTMFDSLTFKPACDDRSIVRYSAQTGAVTAATPPRLVAEITSPSFLDYDLISDFFLSFRSFLETQDLLHMLMARLRWAWSRKDPSGVVVKVRTFVAIRHWVLNYFIDDFVIDYNLRDKFCHLLNDFTDNPVAEARQKMPTKIVGELKKCWRRMCAQFWDGSEFGADLGSEVPITPGGIAGHRDPSLNPSFWEIDQTQAPRLDIALQTTDLQLNRPSFRTDVSKAGHIDSILLDGIRPRTPDQGADGLFDHPASPISTASLDVISCSFPTKTLRAENPDAANQVRAHPADPSSIYTASEPIASTPRALTGKRVRPQTSHRRDNSLTDSLREHGKVVEKVMYKNTELLLTLPYAGSLVRGDLLPPGQPFVDTTGMNSKGGSRHTTVVQSPPVISVKPKTSPSAMSNQGMRKLLGSVRRALSTRGQAISPTQGSFIDLAPIGPRGATTNRLPGTAIVPQSRPLQIKEPLRIDVLGALVAEDFKKAVREDATETKSASTATGSRGDRMDYSAAHLNSSFDLRPISDAAITTGSKSIVIVDGTTPLEHLTMTGALTTFTTPGEGFDDSTGIDSGRNVTPPMTPPSETISGNTPRRSSYILSQHVYDVPLSSEPLPSINNSLIRANVGETHDIVVDKSNNSAAVRPSVDFVTRPPNKPPSSYHNRHRRQQSSQSYRSRGSQSRRWNSFHSGFAVHSTIRSFDATTYSEGSIRSDIMPQPLRMLRRKPGGDLKGVTNIAQLDNPPLRRSRSIGSLTAYSESLRSSYIQSPVPGSGDLVDIVNSDYSQNRGELFSLGAVAEQAPKQPLSLFSTHSSKPIMRPSFEAEAQKLAQIPDDADDDGGVESALLKLEGKYQRKTVKLSIEPLNITSGDLENLRAESSASFGAGQTREEKKKHRQQHVVDEEMPENAPSEDDFTLNVSEAPIPRQSEISSFFSDDSRETYNSVPLLDRGLTDEGRSRTHTHEWTDHSILEGPDTPVEQSEVPGTNSSLNASFEFIDKPDGIEPAVERSTVAIYSEDQSFLNVESGDSDLSSELSTEMINHASDAREPHPANHFELEPAQHPSPDPVQADNTENDSSSIKLTLVEALQLTPKSSRQRPWPQKPMPPTPVMTPTTAMYHEALGLSSIVSNYNKALHRLSGPPEKPAIPSSSHLPFILAFDSEILAQQFTLIEKDALNEVDWKELIEMKWKDSHNDSRSWVDFLRNTEARGVEVVIARFNIMVKWAISEIVLTEELEERARCIVKYIHIAIHCRRYRNFATMSQIVIALTSNEIGRLAQTWAMVSPADMRTMKSLETLVSPTKNFLNLRAEMEGGSISMDNGCIPFVGIYTHDLLFNSQRPSEIASSLTTPPLVNFERCRIAASVIKTLLRLLESSTYYSFQPVEGITERCLWMGALSDDEIRRRSNSLEKA
ncbi:ras GEF [Xylariaceae sp. FL0255]|nr:ras GEF [Xylariaceae sp. FL0255]